MEDEIENLKNQISEVQKIEGWFPLISDLLEFMESYPASSDYKVIYLKAFYRGTIDLMNQISFDENELSKSIEAFKEVYKKGLRDCLIEFSEKFIGDPVPRMANLTNTIHKFKRKKILEGLGGEKLSDWEELILNFYTNEIENLKTISIIKPLVIETKNKAQNRKYHGDETQLEGYSKKRWALVLWYENLGSGIPADNYYRDDYMNIWDDPIQRTQIDPAMKRGMKDKIDHYRWAVNHIQYLAGKVEAQEVLEDLEKQLIKIKSRKK
jgi:hypothetical protein